MMKIKFVSAAAAVALISVQPGYALPKVGANGQSLIIQTIAGAVAPYVVPAGKAAVQFGYGFVTGGITCKPSGSSGTANSTAQRC